MTRTSSDDRRRMAKGEAVTTVKTRKQGNVTVRTTVTKKKGETDVDTLYTGVAFKNPSAPRKTVKKASDKPKKKAVAKRTVAKTAVATERAVYGPVNHPEMRGDKVYVTPKIPSIANLDNLSRPALDKIAKQIHDYAYEKIQKHKRGSWRFGYYYVALHYSDAWLYSYRSIGYWRMNIRKARDAVSAAESMSFDDAQKVYKWTNNERRIVYAAAAKLEPPTREEIDAERDGHRIRLQLYGKLMRDTDGIPFRSRSGQITWVARNLLVEADTGIDSSPMARELRQANVKKAANLLIKSRGVLKNENWAPVESSRLGLSEAQARLMFKKTLKNKSVSVAEGYSHPVNHPELRGGKAGVPAFTRKTGPISSSDPDALARLDSKLAILKKDQELMKAANAYWRKHKTLKGMPGASEDSIARIEAIQIRNAENFGWTELRQPFASFMLSNNLAEIKRLEARIRTVSANAFKTEHTEKKKYFVVSYDPTDDRIRLYFDERPSREITSILKSNGWKWSPTNEAWQRQWTPDAEKSVSKVEYYIDHKA